MGEKGREKADGIINGTNEIVTRRALVTRKVPKGTDLKKKACGPKPAAVVTNHRAESTAFGGRDAKSLIELAACTSRCCAISPRKSH